MRHLHDGFDEYTVCGEVRAEGVISVHVTKARKTDCEDCRVVYRNRVRDLRESQEFFARKAMESK